VFTWFGTRSSSFFITPEFFGSSLLPSAPTSFRIHGYVRLRLF
jgi:hypothetical protein